MKYKMICLTSPSGGGKSTIARYIFDKYPLFKLSVSATTRKPRPNETEGKEYYFLSEDDFRDKIAAGDFVEHEKFFDNHYGTLKSEVDRILGDGNLILFDIDVKGALSIKKIYPEEALLVFLSPKSFATLERRLKGRRTESEEQIKARLERAAMEMSFIAEFDFVIVNDRLEETFERIDAIIEKYFVI